MREIKIIFFDAGGTLLDLDAERICDHLQKNLDIFLDPSRFHRAQCQTMFAISQIVGVGKRSTEEVKREFFTILKRQLGIAENRLAAAVEAILVLLHSEISGVRPPRPIAPLCCN